jgi:2-C-methyl-D-erythritol 4-phosphate cytidylyltransferase
VTSVTDQGPAGTVRRVGSVWTIVVAAGAGQRYGGAKQYERLGDRRVIDWSLATAAAATDGVVVVVAESAPVEAVADQTVTGGTTRSASVRAGLAAVPGEAEVIVVHDAARPLASPALFAAVIGAVRAGADAAVPGVAVTDTIRRRDGGPLERDELVAVQTPQAFAADRLRAAHATEPEATDDASLIEAAGGAVVVVTGEPRNAKITSPDDLVVAAALVGARA